MKSPGRAMRIKVCRPTRSRPDEPVPVATPGGTHPHPPNGDPQCSHDSAPGCHDVEARSSSPGSSSFVGRGVRAVVATVTGRVRRQGESKTARPARRALRGQGTGITGTSVRGPQVSTTRRREGMARSSRTVAEEQGVIRVEAPTARRRAADTSAATAQGRSPPNVELDEDIEFTRAGGDRDEVARNLRRSRRAHRVRRFIFAEFENQSSETIGSPSRSSF